MRDDSQRTVGLSGDLGWNDTEDASLNGLRSALLLAATSAYFGSVWLLSGLPPLALLASRLLCKRRKDVGNPSSSRIGKWRNEQV